MTGLKKYRHHKARMEAIEAGFQPGRRGDDPKANPYEKMTEEWNVWNRWHGFGVESLDEQINEEGFKA